MLVDRDERRRSIAFAVCLLGGLRGELPEQVGITHLVEHVLFKRTARRSTLEIAQALDDLGGDVNGFTDADSLCLHAVVPKERFSELLALFAELLLESRFTEDDVRVEKEVIRQEILEATDDPDDAVYQCFASHFWKGSMLAQPVFGTIESLEMIGRAETAGRLRDMLQGSRLMIAAAGDINPDECRDAVRRHFSGIPRGSCFAPAAPRPHRGIASVVRPVGQVHLLIGAPFPAQRDPDWLTGELISAIVGEAMSSRLFQLLREQHGLVYEVSSEIDAFTDAAAFEIAAVVEPQNLEQVLSLTAGELQRIRSEGLAEEELQRAVRMVSALTDMESDSLSSRLWRAVESEVVFGRYVSPRQVVQKLREIAIDDVQRVIEQYLAPGQFLLALAGDVEELAVEGAIRTWCGEGGN